MGTSGYVTLAGASSTSSTHNDDINMKYINRLSYAGPSNAQSVMVPHPAMDILNLAEASSSPPKYSPTIENEGYRVGQGGMAPKGGIYWSPPNSPKTAELQLHRQQQHKTWKMEQQGIQDLQISSNGCKAKRRRFRKLLRKLSSSGSSSEE